ncbi:hypothetical protein [Heyndrickxia acidicola]|uniref:Uncharacterized protein n=1 Tax=Heyndrickxia acidicola TaxID=209389 RepID=A0ABU6MCK3_9BACI|nr:hypothetical protein [Heyndrickxia acidicola]MED1202391.1 hypothetical protein [Heyndrickxia acidicola]
MKKWNEEAATNNNLGEDTLKFGKKKDERNAEFAEELADGGERNKYIENRHKK